MKKQIVGFGVAMAALVACAGTQQARAQTTSDGATPATGDTVVTMTVPKFAEVSSIPATASIPVTAAQYAAGEAVMPALISFKVRTNSTAGLTVSVKGTEDGASPLLNADIALTSNDGETTSITALDTTAAPIWTNGEAIDELPASSNVIIAATISNLKNYHANGATGYKNTLTFTVLPN